MENQNISVKTIPVLKSRGVLKAALFGSVARGEARKNSDVDLLVTLPKNKTLLDLVSTKLDLEENKFLVKTFIEEKDGDEEEI